MIQLGSPVGTIPKIGTRYKFLLEKLAIATVGDLLYHFPFRYEDYSKTKKIQDLVEGEAVTIEVTLDKVKNIYTRYSKKITLADVSDETGNIKLMWFNQHYIKKQLVEGQKYRFSGKISNYQTKPTLFNATFESAEEPFRKTGKLAAVYPETVGVASAWLSSRINDVLCEMTKVKAETNAFEEFLPKEILGEYNFLNFEKAITDVHFPKSNLEIEPARKRFEFEELFLELLKVENRKAQWHEKKVSVSINQGKFEGKIKSFIKSLPFELTESQKTAVEDIFRDISKKHPMNRLLEGDVGTGKTIVAIIASYLTFLCGFKVLYMAPTEILARQHYETFKTFLDALGVKVALITGNRNKKETDEDYDILIGTHAILYNIKKTKGIGLIVIDEQHRFGVEQRTELLTISEKNSPHVLTMTATPIPRTLALTLYGDLSLSTLKTSPNKDKKITTKAIPEKSRDQAYQWIRNRGEATFIVCPLIAESEFEGFENIKAATAEFENLKNGVFKGLSMGLLHGRMKSKEKQEVVKKFREGEIKVLVSTPVIEVGIDIPEAAIIVIESAERYGLASLHQLRGRVGRGAKEGFCFVFMSNNSRDGYRRLKNLENISDGMKLAEIDMQMRGQGDIYGTMQHGFKRFKIADINNLELLEKTKLWSEKIFPKLEEYPLLKKRVLAYGGKWAVDN